MAEQVPIIDIAPYYSAGPKSPEGKSVVQQLHSAASTWGFFLITNTEVKPQTQANMLSLLKSFFDLPIEVKKSLDVRNGGVAWRGYMPIGGEQTHGELDWKEGLYVGPEHADDHPLINLPLHGKNQFPDEALPNMRNEVLTYIHEAANLGKTLTDMFSLGLGLGEDELRNRFLDPEPIVLQRCFKYAPVGESTLEDSSKDAGFGIGEHTDFGYLTILKSDSPGLQILSPSDKWIDVPVIENSFIINIGDMFDQLTHGRYRSRPHRACRPKPGAPPRYSFPLFFDFAWDAKMDPLPLDHLPPMSDEERSIAEKRWAGTTFREAKGTWSQYLAHKVKNIFPNLSIPDFEPSVAPSTRFTRVIELPAA